MLTQHLSSHTVAQWAATVILLQHRIDGLQMRLSLAWAP